MMLYKIEVVHNYIKSSAITDQSYKIVRVSLFFFEIHHNDTKLSKKLQYEILLYTASIFFALKRAKDKQDSIYNAPFEVELRFKQTTLIF